MQYLWESRSRESLHLREEDHICYGNRKMLYFPARVVFRDQLHSSGSPDMGTHAAVYN